MTFEEEAKELRKQIAHHWSTLDDLRKIGASEEQKVAVRRKVYTLQDRLVEVVAKGNLILKGEPYGKLIDKGWNTRHAKWYEE